VVEFKLGAERLLGKTTKIFNFAREFDGFRVLQFTFSKLCKHFINTLAVGIFVALFHLSNFAFAQTEPVREFAVGGAIYSFGNWDQLGVWDHTILKLKLGEKDEKYFVLFTSFNAVSRELGKTTSLRITTQIYEVVEGGFQLIRDEKTANAIFELGEIVLEQSLTDNIPTLQENMGKACDFLSRRFWPFGTQKAKKANWYFLRLSSRQVDSGVSSNWGCENLDGEKKGTSQITMMPPNVYDLGGKIIFIDRSFPIAILASANFPFCIVGTFSRERAKAERVLHVFDSRPLPQILTGQLPNSDSVFSFNMKFHNAFDGVWAQLTNERSCLTYDRNDLELASFLDAERKYIRVRFDQP
jgi:hypothetical protein